MKNVSHLVILLMILSVHHIAQAQFVNSGFRASLNTANAFDQNTFNKLGMSAGLVTEINPAKFMKLTLETNLIMSGDTKHFFEANDAKYYSVNLPAMLVIMPKKNFHIGVGADVSYLLFSSSGPIPTERFAAGAILNLEYRLFKRLGIGLRYNHTFATAQTLTNFELVNPDWQDQYGTISLSVAYYMIKK